MNGFILFIQTYMHMHTKVNESVIVEGWKKKRRVRWRIMDDAQEWFY